MEINSKDEWYIIPLTRKESLVEEDSEYVIEYPLIYGFKLYNITIGEEFIYKTEDDSAVDYSLVNSLLEFIQPLDKIKLDKDFLVFFGNLLVIEDIKLKDTLFKLMNKLIIVLGNDEFVSDVSRVYTLFYSNMFLVFGSSDKFINTMNLELEEVNTSFIKNLEENNYELMSYFSEEVVYASQVIKIKSNYYSAYMKNKINY